MCIRDRELIDRIAQNDMVRGITIAAGGFFGPQGRELRIPLALSLIHILLHENMFQNVMRA